MMTSKQVKELDTATTVFDTHKRDMHPSLKGWPLDGCNLCRDYFGTMYLLRLKLTPGGIYGAAGDKS